MSLYLFCIITNENSSIECCLQDPEKLGESKISISGMRIQQKCEKKIHISQRYLNMAVGKQEMKYTNYNQVNIFLFSLASKIFYSFTKLNRIQGNLN